jgi:hypothetical protein
VPRPGIVATAVLLLLLTIGPSPADNTDVVGRVSLDELLSSLEKAAQDAGTLSRDPPWFIIKKIDLKLKGETRQEGGVGAGFKIPIFEAGAELKGKVGQATAETLEVSLAPRQRTVVGGNVAIDLKELLKTLKETFSQHQSFSVLETKWTQLWTLQKTVDGKVDVVLFSANGNIDLGRSQEVTFILCQTRNQQECVSG